MIIEAGLPLTPAVALVLSNRLLGVRRSEEHTSELQSRLHLVCRLLLEKKKQVEVKPRADSRGDFRLGIAQQYVFRQHPRLSDAFLLAVTHANALMGDGARLLLRLASGK